MSGPSALDAVVQRLDLLPSEFVSPMLRMDAVEVDSVIERVLQRIGEALAIDHVSFEWAGDSARPAKSWSRSGSVGSRAALTIPVVVAAQRLGALSVALPLDGGSYSPVVESRLRTLADLLTLALLHGRGPAAETAPATEIAPVLDAGLELHEFEDIIGDSADLQAAMGRVLEVAPTNASVVIVGETGTGKELFARAVHNRSRRFNRPFVRVNCAALPPSLIESELFGHERGAFTGAVSMRQGRFELAHTGTLFLDEIGDLPPDVQVKLLRVLQEGEFERVGSSQTRQVDVRVIAATHHDLEAAVKDGRFRADLYYRLNVFPIALPPLRERTEDMPRLVWFFINRRQRALGRKITSVPAAVFSALQQHAWPGNVRELENVIERAMIHSTTGTLTLDDGTNLSVWRGSRDNETLEEAERRHIEHALRRCRWRINGKGNAADVLGLHPNTLRNRMKKLGIRRPAGQTVVGIGRLSA
jgi:transcriptional regulator with GAF, ATPase, and Fis domain